MEDSQDMGLLFIFLPGAHTLMERNLSFTYHYQDDSCPVSVHVVPNPNTISDMELVLTTNTCIQALAKKHGLEQALTMVTDAACGKLINGSRFDTHWLNSEGNDDDQDKD